MSDNIEKNIEEISEKKQEDKYWTRFKKGQSGNLNGRPKGSISITTELKNHLRRNPRKCRALIELGLKKALQGNFKWYSLLLKQIDPNQINNAIQINTEGNIELKVVPLKELNNPSNPIGIKEDIDVDPS